MTVQAIRQSFDSPLERYKWLWAGAIVVAVGCAALAAAYGAVFSLLPLVAMAVALTFMWPRAGIYILILSMYFRIDLPGLYGKYPGDVFTFLIIFGVFFGRLAEGRRPLDRAWVTSIFAVILGAFALTLIGAYDLQGGIVNWFRHLQLFLLILALLTCMEPKDRILIVRWLLLITTTVSIYNVAVFVGSGGSLRVFGTPGQFFSLYSALAVMHTGVGFVLGRTFMHRFGWGILLLINFAGLMATQTRAAMMQAMVGVVILVAVTLLWAWRSGHWPLQRRVVTLLISLALLIVIVLSGLLPIFEAPATRITNALEGRAGTVALRLFLWQVALGLFLDSPIFGIGLAQTSTMFEWLPEWHLQPLGTRTFGLGSHNDVVDYLACTGLVGTLPILWLLWRMVQTGAARIARVRTERELALTLHLWIPIASMAISFFFKENLFYSLSGMMTAVYFAMWVKHTQLPQPLSSDTNTART